MFVSVNKYLLRRSDMTNANQSVCLTVAPAEARWALSLRAHTFWTPEHPFLSPELRGFFSIYLSCSSGKGQKLIFFDWLIQTVCAITLTFFGFYA